jgi:hypothetical protein
MHIIPLVLHLEIDSLRSLPAPQRAREESNGTERN